MAPFETFKNESGCPPFYHASRSKIDREKVKPGVEKDASTGASTFASDMREFLCEPSMPRIADKRELKILEISSYISMFLNVGEWQCDLEML